MTATTPARRRSSARTWSIVALSVTCVALYSVLVPLHTVAYGTVLPVAMLLGIGVCGAPLLAPTHPRTATVAFFIAAFALPLFAAPDLTPTVPWPWSVPALMSLALLVLVLAVRHGWRFALAAWVANIAASLAAPLIRMDAASPAALTSDLIVTAAVSAVALLVGVLLAGRIRIAQELARSRELTAIEQSRRVLVEERARIARELHDVVAHSMSVIQVQASTARYRIAGLPDDATAEFDDIAATARGSLTEMRRLLGVLRTDDAGPQLEPQQGLGDIPALVESMRRAGVDVTLALAAPADEPPASVQITTYRIVQEALSNAVRHAPGSAISVAVTATRDTALTIRVHNDAVGETATDATPGHGLRGMRERVALVAGSLSAGPDPAGGWTVWAQLDWSAAGGETA